MASKSSLSSIDSCIILRVIEQNIPAQYLLAKNLLLSGGDFYADDVAIMEVIYVLTKEHMPRNEIVERLKIFLANPGIFYNSEVIDEVFERYLSHPSLSFDDCMLEARVRQYGRAPLWTFDRKFANQSNVARLVA